MNTFGSIGIGNYNWVVEIAQLESLEKKEDMDSQEFFFDPLVEKARTYGKTSIELYKLKAIEKTSEVVSSLISRMLAIVVLGLFLLMTSIGVAYWLGEVLGKVYFGFLCVGGFYGAVGLVLYFFLHNWMKERTGDAIIKKILN